MCKTAPRLEYGRSRVNLFPPGGYRRLSRFSKYRRGASWPSMWWLIVTYCPLLEIPFINFRKYNFPKSGSRLDLHKSFGDKTATKYIRRETIKSERWTGRKSNSSNSDNRGQHVVEFLTQARNWRNNSYFNHLEAWEEVKSKYRIVSRSLTFAAVCL